MNNNSNSNSNYILPYIPPNPPNPPINPPEQQINSRHQSPPNQSILPTTKIHNEFPIENTVQTEQQKKGGRKTNRRKTNRRKTNRRKTKYTNCRRRRRR